MEKIIDEVILPGVAILPLVPLGVVFLGEHHGSIQFGFLINYLEHSVLAFSMLFDGILLSYFSQLDLAI